MITFCLEDPAAPLLRRLIPWLDLCLEHLDIVPEVGGSLPVVDGIFVRGVGYPTHEQTQCDFETHWDHVDVQVGLTGGEIIDLAHRSSLKPKTEWSASDDVVFYDAPVRPSGRVGLGEGCVLVLFPEDAHRCGSSDAVNASIHKLVFKVPRKLWGAGQGEMDELRTEG